jgi:hypothetical protein
MKSGFVATNLAILTATTATTGPAKSVGERLM